MNISTDKINCYFEGVRVPIISFKSAYSQNKLGTAIITIPIGNVIYAKMWANALTQITFIDLDNKGLNKEKLLFQGFVAAMTVHEERSIMELSLESVWTAFNFNSTLDYVSPRKYGLQKMEQGLRIYVGNESEIASPLLDSEVGYKLSERYVFMDLDKESSDLSFDDPETFKLEYIINHAPLAERFAFSFFEDISYKNFLLSRSFIERLNLLNKVSAESERDKTSKYVVDYEKALSSGFNISFDPKRSGLDQLYKFDLLKAHDEEVPIGSEPVAPGKIDKSGKPVDFMVHFKNDPRIIYIDPYGSYGGQNGQQWCTIGAGNAVLTAAEKIYTIYKVKVNVGDFSEIDASGNFKLASGHVSHKTGNEVDISIPGATNSKMSDYDFDRCKNCIKAFFESGARQIGFDASNLDRQKILQAMGDVPPWSGHKNHFHVNY